MKRLEAEGREAVPFLIPEVNEIVDQFFVNILSDNGKSTLEDSENGILDKSIIVNWLTHKCRLLLRKVAFLIVKLLSPSTGREWMAACYPRCRVSKKSFWYSIYIHEKYGTVYRKNEH